jgi:hypothetical protein
MRLFRFLPAFGAERQIVVDRLPEGPLDLIDGPSLKGDHVPQTDHLAVEDVRLVVKFDLARVALVLHHDLIPPSSRKRRMDFTAPRSVTFNNIMSSFNSLFIIWFIRLTFCYV